MVNSDDTDANKDIPPWLQPVPEAEDRVNFLGSKRGRLIAAGVAVGLIAVFVAAIVFLYNDSPKEGPRHIAADAGPVRERPAEAGGMQVDHQDKAVLEIGDGAQTSTRVEIGAQPEQPVKEIPDIPADTAEDAAAGTDTIGDLAAAAVESEKPVDREAEKATAPPVQAPPAPSPAVSQQPVATAGQYLVQLGAYGSEQSAATAWRTIKARFPRDLDSLEPSYVPVQSGDRTLYRLRVGMLASRASADAVCISLRTQQQACFVVNP